MHNQDLVEGVDSLILLDYTEFMNWFKEDSGLSHSQFMKIKNFKSLPIHLVYGQKNFDSHWRISDRYQSGEVEYTRVS